MSFEINWSEFFSFLGLNYSIFDKRLTSQRRRKKERLKALLMKKYYEGGSEYSRIFIFKISIGRRIFLRNTKKGQFD